MRQQLSPDDIVADFIKELRKQTQGKLTED